MIRFGTQFKPTGSGSGEATDLPAAAGLRLRSVRARLDVVVCTVDAAPHAGAARTGHLHTPLVVRSSRDLKPRSARGHALRTRMHSFVRRRWHTSEHTLHRS